MRFRQSFKVLIYILFLLCCFVLIAHAAILYQAVGTVTLAWDDNQTGINHYEVVLIRDGTGVTYGPYITTTKTIIVPKPKSGVYEVRVRGVRQGEYSTWHSSLDNNAMLKTGINGSWKVSFKPSGPTGPIIIN